MDNLIIEKFKYITVGFVEWTESVKLMVQEHYDIPEYKNSIIFCNRLPEMTPKNIDWMHTFNKRIYYMLEHKVKDEDYYGQLFECWDEDYANQIGNLGINELWTMDYMPQFAVKCYNKFNIPINYKPVRYTSLITPVKDIYTTPKTVDCVMVGLIKKNSPQRLDFYEELESNHYFSFKAITQTYNINSIINELNSSKYILDIPRLYEMITQNQVRIFELLCMGYTVITKKCDINLFPGLIYEYENVSDVGDIVKRNEYINPTEAYKEMTYTDEAYEKYVNYLIEQQINQ